MAPKRKYNESPRLINALIMGDDPKLMARFSSILAQKNAYLPLIDSPRLTRPDADAEIIRRNNVAAAIKIDAIIYADLTDEVQRRFERYFPKKRIHYVRSVEELRQASHGLPMRIGPKLEWGRDQIGIGLLKALYSGAEVEFVDRPSPREAVASLSGYLVVCEEGNELGQVIAANYAYSIGAGMLLIPEVPDEDADEILDQFYGSQENRDRSPTETLTYLRQKLRDLAGPLPLGGCSIATFFTNRLPWGYGFPETPSTHIFLYPDCGLQVARGVAAEQNEAPGIRTIALVDPAETDAADIVIARDRFVTEGAFVHGCGGKGATVRRISLMVELYPYDFLMIATHCGDVSGSRWEFDFTDSEGIARNMIVDVAIGVASPAPDSLRPVPDDEKFTVTTMFRPIALDGVDWNDPKKKEKLHIGTAVIDFFERTKDLDKFRPKKKTPVDRVHGSAALKMHDHNLLLTPQSLADNCSPIVLNNACASWHMLAGNCMFAGARAYIGTLFSVVPVEVLAVTEILMGKQFGKSLAVALWHAQNEVYGSNGRRPYILVGTHFQRFRVTRTADLPRMAFTRMVAAFRYWLDRWKETDPKEEFRKNTALDRVQYLKECLDRIKAQWLT